MLCCLFFITQIYNIKSKRQNVFRTNAVELRIYANTKKLGKPAYIRGLAEFFIFIACCGGRETSATDKAPVKADWCPSS